MPLDLGIEPAPHWWEATALTTVPPLHPCTPNTGKYDERPCTFLETVCEERTKQLMNNIPNPDNKL